MNKITFIALIALALGLSIASCKKAADPIITPTDTTKKVPPNTKAWINSFKLNGVKYNASTDTILSVATYLKSTKITQIYCYMGAGSTYGEYRLHFPGNQTGSWSFKAADNVDLNVATGGPFGDIKRKEYAIKQGGEITIKITEYGAVGEKIKGTFTGELQTGINTGNITEGIIDIKRDDDE